VKAALALQRAIVERVAAQQGVDSVRPVAAHQLGLSLVRMEQTDDGLVWLDRAVEAAGVRQNVTEQIGSRLSRARALLLLGRLDRMSADLDDADRLMAGDSRGHRTLATASRWLRAEWQLARGDPTGARAAADHLLVDVGRPARPRSLLRAHMLALRARARLALQQPALALADARAAVAVAEALAIDPARSVDVGAALHVLAHAQHAVGDADGARRSAQRAADMLEAGLGPQHAATLAAARLR
jgi:hypothetical protein